MTLPRAASLVSVLLVGASLWLAPIEAHAGPGPDEASLGGPRALGGGEAESQASERPIEGPARPPSEQPTHEVSPPPPTLEPAEPGIEFAVPPPEPETETETESEDVDPDESTSPIADRWPDPGTAPNDGNAMLVLGGATLGIAGAALGIGLTVGQNRDVPLEYLLPATIIPTTITTAFGVGALYLGATRARAYRRWEIGYRVVGEPQGGGLRWGGRITLLGALGTIPIGVRMMLAFGDVQGGATLIALGSAAAVATPILLVVGKRRANKYARTGGWHRRPLPPVPQQSQTRLQVTPLVAPTLGGFMLGANGRF